MKLLVICALFAVAALGGATKGSQDKELLSLLKKMLVDLRMSEPAVAGPVPPEGKICSKVVDIVLVIDDSGSLEWDEFKSLIDFAKRFVSLFEVGPDAAHVGIITFSDDTNIRLGFSESQSNDEVTAVLDGLPHIGGGTNTFLALDQARLELYGGADVRDVSKLTVVLTDGNSADAGKTAEAARLLRGDNDDVTVFAIGIGSAAEIKQEELDNIASEPSSEFAFRADDFDALAAILGDFVAQACKSLPTIDLTGQSGGCDLGGGQLVFVMDESGSVHWRDFDLVKDFTQRIVDSYADVGAGFMTFGAITYNEEATTEMDLSEELDKEATMETLAAMKHDGGGTKTWLGLEAMVDQFARTAGPDGGAKIAIVVSDGNSESLQQTADAARAAQEAGITMFAVAVGTKEELGLEELNALASEDDYVFPVEDYSALAAIVDPLTSASCWAILKK